MLEQDWIKNELFDAVMSHNREKLKELIESGADIHFHYEPGKSDFLMESAVKDGNVKAAELLLEFGGNIHAADDILGEEALLIKTILNQDEKMVNFLLKAGADVHAKDTQGSDHPIRIASTLKSTNIVKSLVEAGANVHAFVKTFDLLEEIPLKNAAMKENFEMVKYLLSVGADPNAAFLKRFDKEKDAYSDKIWKIMCEQSPELDRLYKTQN